ncbi:DUF1569 domain-containing protein [Flavobacterium columnare NBRC 100251 = ATCC 23463]|uniref:DUF1569 domain-containing protein n=2 Tax=Flavobacterium columnare TaxID=996 RepID=G8X9T5_FLACA|nr:DUF1569 domain-containing protein [Flavobacterium columnare]AEW87283.1 hypothetical protein FCOL_12420 [Flavobacterium columnare ATCC 49512]AMO19075.1 DUF1569 domain-containing protein [Flavobacterium columnare]ANO47996.1 hypothetical protein Pf1_02542 [Flavobacterium columnare]APT21426.1 hypothetical protein BU993_01480 [Flavobacterium columnare]AUX17004.1 hypothetical protein AQ623_00780 [Flavobacterium columnare]
MKNIFIPSDNEELINRIAKLTPETQPLWGKMTVDQMMKHCIAPIDVATGDLVLKIPFLMSLLGKLMKNKVLNNKFKHNSPTAPQFIFKEKYDFEKVKSELIEKTRNFQNGTEVIKLAFHPFWGKLTSEDWNKLQWNHLDHHLRQFGV